MRALAKGNTKGILNVQRDPRQNAKNENVNRWLVYSGIMYTCKYIYFIYLFTLLPHVCHFLFPVAHVNLVGRAFVVGPDPVAGVRFDPKTAFRA